MEDVIFYDILSDMSLEQRDKKPSDLWKYSEKHLTIEGQEVIIYKHKRQRETHYLSCDGQVKFKSLLTSW